MIFIMLSVMNLSEYGKKNFWYFPTVPERFSDAKKRFTTRGWLFFKLAGVFILLAMVVGMIGGLTNAK